MEVDTHLTLHVDKTKSGMFVVTSPDVKGLLIATTCLLSAMSAVPQALEDLRAARAEALTTLAQMDAENI